MDLLSLKEKLLQEMGTGLPFMQGREKGDIELDTIYSISEYGYLEGEDGEFIAFTVKGNEDNFFFGGSVLTERFKKIDNTFSKEDIKTLLDEGIDVKFGQKQSKNKRKYVTVEFI